MEPATSCHLTQVVDVYIPQYTISIHINIYSKNTSRKNVFILIFNYY